MARLKHLGWVLAIAALASCAWAQAPVVLQGAIVNAASFRPASDPNGALAPGTIAAVFGANLGGNLIAASTVPLSTTINDTSVTFAAGSQSFKAPLYYTSSGQISVQVPFEVPNGTVTAFVTKGGQSSTPINVSIAAVSPAIFTLDASGKGQGIVTNALTGSFAAPTGSIPGRDAQPVKAGDFLVIWSNGLGAVNNQPATGAGGPSGPLADTKQPVTVTLAGRTIPAAFSGLVPTLVGLYQVNIQVPTGIVANSAVPLTITVGGVTSNQVTIAVQ